MKKHSKMRKVRDSTYPIPCHIICLTLADVSPYSQAETPDGGGDCAADGQGITADQARHATCY